MPKKERQEWDTQNHARHCHVKTSLPVIKRFC